MIDFGNRVPGFVRRDDLGKQRLINAYPALKSFPR